jgi:hypothetical protein
VTTAQERRRARRIARRVAQESGSSSPEARAFVEQPAVTHTVEHLPEPPPVASNGHHGWIAVTAAPKPSSSGRTATAPKTRTRWVAVKARKASVLVATPEGVESAAGSPNEPLASGTLEPLPHDPHQGASDASGPKPQSARALHPKTRAIRITRVKTNGKRRWSLDFLVRAPDMHLPSE